MEKSFKDALKNALEVTGRSLADVTRSAGVSYDQYKGFMQGKSRSTNVDDAFRIAAALGVSLDDLMEGNLSGSKRTTIAIAGKVGAGAKVPLIDPFEKGDGPQVVAPARIPTSGFVAVQIEGDSMEPVYSDGDFLFYSRPTHEGVPSETIGHRCICEDADGFAWVKQVKRGDTPNTFHLISLNMGAESMWNVELKWAARVVLHWPSELAQTV